MSNTTEHLLPGKSLFKIHFHIVHPFFLQATIYLVPSCPTDRPVGCWHCSQARPRCPPVRPVTATCTSHLSPLAPTSLNSQYTSRTQASAAPAQHHPALQVLPACRETAFPDYSHTQCPAQDVFVPAEPPRCCSNTSDQSCCGSLRADTLVGALGP